MPHDPLETLLRVRRRAVDEGRRALGISLAAATAAANAVRARELEIARETEHANDPNGEDSLVEAFAAWLPGARQRVTQVLADQDRQEAEVARCRADLTACRTALETLEQLRDSRRATLETARAKHDQRQLDEIVSSRKIEAR